MLNQRGFTFIYFLMALAIIILGIKVGSTYLKDTKTPSKSLLTTQISNQPVSSQPTSSELPNDKKAVANFPAFSSSPNTGIKCNIQKDICFESDNLQANITEGYLEDDYYWITEELKLTGKGSGGFKLKIEGFPKEFTVRSPVQAFKDGTSQKFYVRAQKEVAKKGSFTGKISVYSYLSGNTTSANLTINYTGGDNKSVHTVPSEVIFNCKITYSGEPPVADFRCDDYQTVKFYAYYGGPKKVEIRSIPEKDAKRSLILRTLDLGTTFAAQNVASLHIEINGFPRWQELENEPTAIYKGAFIFVDQATQKELLRTPYTFKVTNEK